MQLHLRLFLSSAQHSGSLSYTCASATHCSMKLPHANNSTKCSVETWKRWCDTTL